MTGFWAAAILMTVAAVVAVLLPMLRRPGKQGPGRAEYDITVYKDQLAEIERDRERGLLGQDEAGAAAIEIQRRILKAAGPEETPGSPPDSLGAPAPRNRALPALIAAGVVVTAFALYMVLGSPDKPNLPYAGRDIGAEIAAREGRMERREVIQLVARLEQRLKENPGDADGWVLLARTYLTHSEFAPALAAYRRAMEAGNRQPDIAVDYGEALVLAEKGLVTLEARALFREVVAADPLNPKAGYYLGLSLAQQGKVKEALQAWVDLRAVSPEGAPWLEAVDQQIASAAQELGLAPWAVKPSAKALALGLTAKTPSASEPAREPARGPSTEDVQAAGQMSAGDRNAMIRSMVQRLADRLADNPDDLEGWRRLARAYEVLGEKEKAEQAQARIKALEK